jgi:hypothetical protein
MTPLLSRTMGVIGALALAVPALAQPTRDHLACYGEGPRRRAASHSS